MHPVGYLKEQPRVGFAVRLVFNARRDRGDIPAVVTVLVLLGAVSGWSLVENCTVDASILFSVVKLSRANGGCLGTRSR